MRSARIVRWVLGAFVLTLLTGVILAMAARLAGSSLTDITDLEVGDCFRLDVGGDGTIDLVEVIACDEPHDAEVVLVDDLNPNSDEPYPDDDPLFDLADARCAAVPDDPRYGVVAIAPTEATWEARRGRVVCVAVPYGGDPVTGSYGTTPAGTVATADA